MLLSDNINLLMEEAGINNVDLGKALGISDETIRSWRKGTKVPTVEKLLKLAEYFEVSLDDLMGRSLDTERTISLPIVGVIAAGPFDILNEDAWDDSKTVQARLLAGRPAKECVLLQVDGDSMAPLLMAGDVLVVHRQSYAVNGNIIVAYDPVLNGYTVKRYQQTGDSVTLVPCNPEYQAMRYNNPNEQQLNLYGVCVGLERKLV